MLTMQAGTSGAVAVVDVTGVIGWDDAQCLEFADKLKAAANQGASSITLRVNSPGGDVFSALSMYDAIRSCKIPVRAEVHGLAASAASLLCMAADTVAMSESAKFMVHQPYAGVWGNPDEIMNYAAMLIKERERMFAIYGGKCGKSWEQVSNDHKASVYYSAAEAIAYGFVDEVIHDDESAGNGEDDDEENAGDEDDESTATAETGNNDEEDDESPTGEEGDDEDEETAPAAGMTGSRLNLKNAAGGIREEKGSLESAENAEQPPGCHEQGTEGPSGEAESRPGSTGGNHGTTGGKTGNGQIGGPEYSRFRSSVSHGNRNDRPGANGSPARQPGRIHVSDRG